MDIRDVSVGQQVKLIDSINVIVDVEGVQESVLVVPDTLTRVISVSNKKVGDPSLEVEVLVCVERNGLKIHKPHRLKIPHPRELLRPVHV